MSGFSISSLIFDSLPVNAPSSYAEASDTGTAAVGSARLYQYVNSAPLVSDSIGNAMVDIFPSLREYMYDVPLVLSNPQGTFRGPNKREAPVDQKKIFNLQLKCREAL